MGALGHGGHGKHKNKASGGYLGSCRSGFGTYGRGNLPEHHVLRWQAKSGVDGYWQVKMGSYGCVGVHGAVWSGSKGCAEHN